MISSYSFISSYIYLHNIYLEREEKREENEN